MYYGLIILTTIMFGTGFALNDIYRQKQGNTIMDSFRFSIIGGIPGIIILILINGLKLEFTWFTFIMAVIQASVGLLFTFCTFKALGRINLSLYSVFSMLGGMVLPVLNGIIFFDEPLTFGRIVCFVFIIASIFMTFEKGSSKNDGLIYYIGVFVLNGMSGVLTKIFNFAPFPKTSAAAFSIMMAIVSITISFVALKILSLKNKEKVKLLPVSIGVGAASGALNRLANYWLVIALAHVDAAVQYPMVTGGVMIVSTIFSYISRNKPSKREIISVALAFAGMLALFIIK